MKVIRSSSPPEEESPPELEEELAKAGETVPLAPQIVK
jgi:hypothetical protein